MSVPRMDLRGMIEKQISRLDSVLAVKVEEAVSLPKSEQTKKQAAGIDTVGDICKLSETICRLISQANTM